MNHDPTCRCLSAVAQASEARLTAGEQQVRAIWLAHQHGASNRQIAEQAGMGREAVRSIIAVRGNGAEPGDVDLEDATGGPVDGTEAYIVGEAGPEHEDAGTDDLATAGGLILPDADQVAEIAGAAEPETDEPAPIGLGGL